MIARATVSGSELWIPALATVAATLALARLAAPLRLLDHGGGAGMHREPRGQSLRLVGGLALAVGLALATFVLVPASEVHADFASAPWPWLAMLAALVVGWIDDASSGGISARGKLCLQALPALAFAAGNDTPLAALPVLGFAAAIAAQNVANTYDNADGVLLATAALAFAPVRPSWSAIALAVLAFNLRPRGRASVLLGDSGSHLIALMLLCEPRAWGAFFVPALDLARVVLVRRAQGRGWWLGDRAHLAHRLQACGFGPIQVALGLAAIGAPAILACALAESAPARLIGLAASALAFCAAVRATPAVDGHGERI